jgi:predicted  nucleic acid-binding Zn-ribbon protein
VVLEHLIPGYRIHSSFAMIELREFKNLRETVQALIRSNDSLRKDHKDFAEKLSSRERQIRELKEKCERYERNRKEANQMVSLVLNKIERLKP